jgi:hypothetical protein
LQFAWHRSSNPEFLQNIKNSFASYREAAGAFETLWRGRGQSYPELVE